MSEQVEDMLDGSCCSLCGCYFEHPKGGIYVHETPTVCEECFSELSEQDKQFYRKADEGIKTF